MIIEYSNRGQTDLGPDFYNKVKLYAAVDRNVSHDRGRFSLVAFLLDAEGSCRRSEDFLYWKNMNVKGLSHHQADEQRTYESQGIYIKTKEIEQRVESISFCITSEPFGGRLDALKAIYVYVSPTVQYQVPLTRIWSFGACTTMQVATLSRQGERWKYVDAVKKFRGKFSTACSEFGVSLA